jgi:hypothetical protein
MLVDGSDRGLAVAIEEDPAMMEMSKQADVPILGTATWQLMESNNTAKIEEKKFRKDAEESQK